MPSILSTFAAIIATYFIARNYDSVDAWGHKVSLLNCKLKADYI
jgi:hypothetical protein